MCLLFINHCSNIASIVVNTTGFIKPAKLYRMQRKKTLFFLSTALLLNCFVLFSAMNKILDRSCSLFDDFQIGKGKGPVKSNAVVLNR